MERQGGTEVLREVSAPNSAGPVQPQWGSHDDGVGSFSRGAKRQRQQPLSHNSNTDPRHLGEALSHFWPQGLDSWATS